MSATPIPPTTLDPDLVDNRMYPSFGPASPSGLESTAGERLDAMRPEGFAPNARYTLDNSAG